MNFCDELKASLEEAVDIKFALNTKAIRTRYEVADVKEIRQQLNDSQSELAIALGTSLDAIKSW